MAALAGIKNLWNKEIVGNAMSHGMAQNLVGRALFQAVATRLELSYAGDGGMRPTSSFAQPLEAIFKGEAETVNVNVNI